MENSFSGQYFRLESHGDHAILWFDTQKEKVNKINEAVAAELNSCLDIVEKQSQWKSLGFLSAKKQSFIVGADIRLIQTLKDKAAAREASSLGHQLFNRLEDLKIPSLVGIEGACMGGGTELSLACTYILMSDSEKSVLGLPEVQLGILPGWGGTYRLPRRIGLAESLPLVLQGSKVRPDKALKLGLADFVVPSLLFEEEFKKKLALLAKGQSLPRQNGKKSVFAKELLGSYFLGRKLLIRLAKKDVLKATKGNYPAPLRILDLWDSHLGKSRKAYLEQEAQAFSDLWATPESHNLVNLFFLMEDAKKQSVGGLSAEQVDALPPTKELGVLGAGVMGGGIAYQSSSSGIRTVVRDLNFGAVGKALAHARELSEKEKKKKKLKNTEVEKRLALIRGQLDLAGFSSLDCVIEAVVENLDVKRKVFAELEARVSSRCLIATNTSSLRLKDMVSALRDPSRFIGLHFFNPVHKMPLVEVVSHPQVSPEALARGVAYVKSIGKTPVVVQDGPGFLVNRLLMPWLNEAGFLLEEGYRIQTLDHAAKVFGMPMGPCELLDEIGIDVASKVAHILHGSLGARAEAARATDAILEDAKKNAGGTQRFGRKSGIGFYFWDKPGGRRLENDQAGIDAILGGGSNPEHTLESIQRRMIYPMINEAALALEEGIASHPADVDLAMIMGTGFPPFRGGLLRYADQVGLSKIVAELERLSQGHGVRLEPSSALKSLAKGRGRFYP